jgi:nitrogen-specific signal transduction histidine kinase
MTSFDNIYIKMTPTMEPAALAGLHHEQSASDSEKLIGRQVAHELNNILTILRGYAERMVVKHGANAALRPELQMISENVLRAERVVRAATPPRNRPAANAGL